MSEYQYLITLASSMFIGGCLGGSAAYYFAYQTGFWKGVQQSRDELNRFLAWMPWTDRQEYQRLVKEYAEEIMSKNRAQK